MAREQGETPEGNAVEKEKVTRTSNYQCKSSKINPKVYP